VQELPLVAIANYRFGTTLNNTAYVIDVRWNADDSSWYMDFFAEDGETVLATGIRIVLGTYLGRHKWVPPFTAGVFVAYDLSGQRKDPGFDDLGTRVVVRYFTAEEVFAIRDGTADANTFVQ
jgi:hypothetical protein